MIAADVAAKVAGRPVRAHGRNFLVCCPAHRDATPSLSLTDGDDGRLLVHCFAGCDPRDVLAAIRDRVGSVVDTPRAPEPVKGTGAYERQQRDKAAWLWSQRQPIAGTIAETYLREARGIACPLPATMGYLPSRKPEHRDALIAAFAFADELEPGTIAAPHGVGAVHLTLLREDGSGKADCKPDKIVVGSPGGLPIVIAAPNDLLGLAIAEGIEDALSVYAATGLGAWAAGSAPFMPKLADAMPDYIEAVTVFAHTDRAGRYGAFELGAKLRNLRSTEVTIEGIEGLVP
jgi:hypothetical protein